MTGAGAGKSALLLGRYDEDEFLRMFAEAGVVDAVEARGFCDVAFEFDASQPPLMHARLFGSKDGARFLLLDACVTELHMEPSDREIHSYASPVPIDLLVVYWLREQDPTAAFDEQHVRLPLQEHPGLGVLRRAFRVALRVARELGKDGIAAIPKYFHDAAIFYRSRLFLFLDPAEQGRFEALLRDLSALSLADATMALVGAAVCEGEGSIVRWQPGLQVTPLSPGLTDYFHTGQYQAACRNAYESSRFVVDPARLEAAREVFERSLSANLRDQPG